MLDELPLSTKLTVARDWFRRSQAGEFPLSGGTATAFERLLNQCCVEADRLQDALAGEGVAIVHGLRFAGVDEPAALAAIRADLERIAGDMSSLKVVRV